MRTLTLSATASVKLDANGNGTAQIGPSHTREVWRPTLVSVNANEAAGTITDEASCKVYCGSVIASFSYVDGTLSGSTGDSTASVAGQALYPGQYVSAVWAGGDPGAQVSMNITGTRTVP